MDNVAPDGVAPAVDNAPISIHSKNDFPVLPAPAPRIHPAPVVPPPSGLVNRKRQPPPMTKSFSVAAILPYKPPPTSSSWEEEKIGVNVSTKATSWNYTILMIVFMY
ncbi:hypothetical protein TSUD_381300 [Trifolium subterraneum]|uniref:Uncharacterized protein n=1 Tax=Trifolium subterraneum TaxID=3900 RepID=A0A2Z6MC67_TRISU|nr:hypothetical protein TSUD_381300 [Trifolium subterraneum]